VKHPSYDPSRALALLPLLAAISREIEERGAALATLEARLEQLVRGSSSDPELLRSLQAEAATHRREMRLSRKELERLGCSVVGTSPLTIRIPTREGDTKKSLFWQPPQAARG
jgi:hypothetical protein